MAPPGLRERVHYAPLLEVAGLITSGALSPVDLATWMLERIASVDPRLRSYATVTAQRALDDARRAEREIAAGRYRGPLHGVPVAVKDLCFTRGIRTAGGCGVHTNFLPAHDATVVTRLEAAGAVLLGKLNLTEGAMVGYHPDFAVPLNPWNPSYWPGVSSSGSGVATAAGLCFASIGTDTGGSIRFPSMANGTVGLKPTYGRVSRHGVLVLADTLDHVGPLARRVADAAATLDAIAGWDEHDPTSLRDPAPAAGSELGAGVRGLRLGVDRRFNAAGTDPGLVAAIDEAIATWARLGAEIVDVEMAPGTDALRETFMTICAYEAARAHRATFPSRAAEYGPFLRAFLGHGATIGEARYHAAAAARQRFCAPFHALLERVDALVCPAGGCAFPIDANAQHGLQPIPVTLQSQFTIPANMAGTPSLTLPCGAAPSGVPYAVQLLGRRLSEAALCRIGQAYEDATRWHERHPPV